MNTTVKALAFALVAVTSAAAIGTAYADHAAQDAAGIVKLERVVISGKRAAAPVVTAQLPRVVILGRTVTTLDLHVASIQKTGKTT
ncbi:hypothetical protein ABT392_04710 [Paucibacter sp. JuS9]|uniref:hypothetical protein n=1 Tax=Roseateles TaxID=93681 RepID=UPI002FE6A4B3